MSLIVDSIFTEWRASLPEGSSHPNTQNGYHLFLLKEICLKRGIPENIVNSVLLMLEQDTYKLKKKDTGEISVFTNKDNYEKALQSDEYEEPEASGTETPVNPTPPPPPPVIDPEAENLKNTGGLVNLKKTDNKQQQKKPKATPVETPISRNDFAKSQVVQQNIDRVVKEIESELETPLDENDKEDKQGEITRLKILNKNWKKFTNAKTNEERAEAVRELVDNRLIARNAQGKAYRKVYFTDLISSMGAKDSMLDLKGQQKNGTRFTQLMSDVIDAEGLDVEMRNSSADRTLAKVSGDHNEAGVVAFLDPSEQNKSQYRNVEDLFSSLGGNHRKANKQNENAAEKVRKYLSKMKPPCKIERAEAMGHLGNNEIKAKYNIDPKRNPTDFFVYCKDGTKKGISAKIYSNPKQITMKNSGTKKASSHYLGNPNIDDKLDSLKEKYNIGMSPSDIQKRQFKTEYLRLWEKDMVKLSKTPDGQQKLSRMWNEVHGCGEDVATLITNKKTGEVKLHDPDHYCDPKAPLKVKYDGAKVVVNFGEEERWIEMVCKTEKDGSVKLLFNHRTT